MTYKLFLDDEREPVEDTGWIIVRNFEEAQDTIICLEIYDGESTHLKGMYS